MANRFQRASEPDLEETLAPRFFWIPKVMFWLLLVSGLVVILTMLLSMLPLFGTEELHVLLDVHRYSGLLVVVVLVIHFYCVLLQPPAFANSTPVGQASRLARLPFPICRVTPLASLCRTTQPVYSSPLPTRTSPSACLAESIQVLTVRAR